MAAKRRESGRVAASNPAKSQRGTAAAPKTEDFASSLAPLIASVKQVNDSLSGFAQLTFDERTHSNGRLRDGEPEAMTSILDTVDRFPALFASLAPRDHGSNDDLVETGPAREALARAQALLPLQQLLAQALSRVSDEVLVQAAKAKDVTLPAYAIIRAHAPIDAKLRASAAKALDFHTSLVKRKKPSKG